MFLLKSILHQFDPEWVHEQTLALCSKIQTIPGFQSLLTRGFFFEDPRLRVSIGNLNFPNPIGLAAGFDKNGIAVPLLQTLGYGHIETGTVTPQAQPGNKKPRLYRLHSDEALINRMGFNNLGIDFLSGRLENIERRIPIGVNLGKNKQTPLDRAYNDYILGMKRAWTVADYFTINISSPNTPNLRSLQQENYLYSFLEKIIKARDELAQRSGKLRQIWLKIAPDLNDHEMEVVSQVSLKLSIDALILTNTTLSRKGVRDLHQTQSGGLSGRPLFTLSNSVLNKMYRLTEGLIPLVGVGGIFTAEEAFRKISLGASLVQIYTGLVFAGPAIVKTIKKGLIRILNQKNLKQIIDWVGSDALL